jgi:hypothetical protein
MQKLLAELKLIVPFKNNTESGDIVLIAAKQPPMLVYALITSIERDPSRKDEWWIVEMTFLTIPLQKVTWTLRTPQMTGMEVFTMGGEERFVKAVDFGSIKTPAMASEGPGKDTGKGSFLKRVK